MQGVVSDKEMYTMRNIECPITDHELSNDPPQIIIKRQCKLLLKTSLEALTKFDLNQVTQYETVT